MVLSALYCWLLSVLLMVLSWLHQSTNDNNELVFAVMKLQHVNTNLAWETPVRGE